MSHYDWITLAITLTGVILYGLYKSRTTKDLDGYFLSNRAMPWYIVLLSIMGTQASAITFLSAPGQAYVDGMRFVQFYFGLPLAMVVLCITFVPIFHRLKVYTAYEYLEKRFDSRTRTLTSLLFLLQRALSTGISIYAPSIILSSLLNWNIYWTNLFMGGLLILYTVAGGAKAVAHTQKFQLLIIFSGMALAGYMVVRLLPEGVGFTDALNLGGKLGKLNVITTGVEQGGFNWGDRYNLISGIIGGFFLQLSYFGTDQSQVGRYLTAKSISESRMGLIMNGLVKIPMQFFILLIGVLVFSFFQFNSHPVSFNARQMDMLRHSEMQPAAIALEQQHVLVQEKKQELVRQWVDNKEDQSLLNQIGAHLQEEKMIQDSVKTLVKKVDALAETNDTNYIFLRFVVDYLPVGAVGLLIAVIFLAAWGSIAAALNSLASSSVVDIHKKFIEKNCAEKRDYQLSKRYTLAWGLFCIATAMFATRMGSLIEAVNILGSLFYGVILGIFLVAFYMKKIGGKAVFGAAVISEMLIIILFVLNDTGYIRLGFLWLNLIGALAVMALSWLFSKFEGLRRA
ncbi:MAG: sodium:solute symporter [Chitinophagaceae bacterium]|nr:sodium:solute symporter [Chitinophagaceae bacterium]